jgi:hypothetical protein
MTQTHLQQLNDIILAPDEAGKLVAYKAKGFPQNREIYLVSGSPVTEVITFAQHDCVLLRTDKEDYLRNLSNEPVAEGERWADHYFEPHTNSLYRQDERGNWYDLEGFRLRAPVFLKGEVLVSLPGKVSRKSWSFAGREAMISTHGQLIQVGKLVYDTALEPVHYFGEKLTGLGRGHISFGGTDQWQEVYRGLLGRGFINEFTGAPLLINDEEIVGHVRSAQRKQHHFEVFRSETRTYVLENHSEGEIRFEGYPLELDLDTYLWLNETEVMLAKNGREQFYLDLNTKQPFHIAEVGIERLRVISRAPIRLPGADLYNVATEHRAFVYDASSRSIYTLNDGALQPSSIAEIPGFEAHFFMAEINGVRKLCDKRTGAVLQFGPEQLEVTEVLGRASAKLLNVRGALGHNFVLDLRLGADKVRLATADGKVIEEVVGNPYRVGDHALQHIRLASLGGVVDRLVDLELEKLTTYTLPEDLTEYPDQPQSSCYGGNALLRINFQEPFEVQGEKYFRATFLNYLGEEREVVLEHSNARPIHIEGAGHRNELIVGFKPETIHRPYRLGENVMVGAITLNEELKQGELLFSIHKNRSWLPFYDSYLPVFRRVIQLKGTDYWPCYLFEVLEHNATGEYIAVEKEEPYRLLAQRKKGKVIPKIVTTKSRALLDPDEVSGLIKLFVDRGMLVEII